MKSVKPDPLFTRSDAIEIVLVLIAFFLVSCPTIFEDGFESVDTSKWKRTVE